MRLLFNLNETLTLAIDFLGILPPEVDTELFRRFSFTIKLEIWEDTCWNLIVTEVALLVIVDLSNTLFKFFFRFMFSS